MKIGRGTICILGLWMVAVVLTGSVLASYHQPFQSPSDGVLALVPDRGHGHWRMLHVLSESCGCSQRVMQHLLARHRMVDVTEQVLLVEGEGDKLPESDELIARLAEEGFSVTRIAATNIPPQTSLHGVPLLVVASPQSRIAYMGGYGERGDEDGAVIHALRTGATMKALPILGCAVGRRMRRQADPVGLKY